MFRSVLGIVGCNGIICGFSLALGDRRKDDSAEIVGGFYFLNWIAMVLGTRRSEGILGKALHDLFGFEAGFGWICLAGVILLICMAFVLILATGLSGYLLDKLHNRRE